MEFSNLHPTEFRSKVRNGEFNKSTSGVCSGYVQANLVILPKEFAKDFKEFCEKNKKPCPVLESLEPGQTKPTKICNSEADVRTDIPKYRIYKKGVLEKEVSNIKEYWNDDMVSFFIGCSFSFEKFSALQKAKIPVRNIEEGRNVSMYKTNRDCIKVGPFSCPLVVSMRPIPKDQVKEACEITGRFTETHGDPVHCGDPSELGIKDLSKVDFGESVTIKEGEVPCFWACGVTAIMSAISIKSDICITHSPGYMFVSDIKDQE